MANFYNCNSRAWVCHHVSSRLVDYCIQETNGIRWHDDQGGRGWPWTHQLISHKTSVNGSSSGACLPTCVGCSDYESVWDISLGVLKDTHLPLVFNSSPPSAAYMRQWTGPSLVQVMACRLIGAKPLPEPILSFCQLDSWEQISVKC